MVRSVLQVPCRLAATCLSAGLRFQPTNNANLVAARLCWQDPPSCAGCALKVAAGAFKWLAYWSVCLENAAAAAVRLPLTRSFTMVLTIPVLWYVLQAIVYWLGWPCSLRPDKGSSCSWKIVLM
jgi:hypothetical protein